MHYLQESRQLQLHSQPALQLLLLLQLVLVTATGRLWCCTLCGYKCRPMRVLTTHLVVQRCSVNVCSGSRQHVSTIGLRTIPRFATTSHPSMRCEAPAASLCPHAPTLVGKPPYVEGSMLGKIRSSTGRANSKKGMTCSVIPHTRNMQRQQ
jgi:hypothetical protein